jgi:hypothetical protein
MKVLVFYAVSLLAFVETSLACKCVQPTVESALNYAASTFRGKVIRELKPTGQNSDDLQQKGFVVRVTRIYKGCQFKFSERIIVTTNSDPASCGVNLAVDKNYVLSGDVLPLNSSALMQQFVNFPTNITSVVTAHACSFNQRWSLVSEYDKEQLRGYKNKCRTICDTGKDCPNGQYCDAKQCVTYNPPCPDDAPPAPCAADPCAVVAPCTQNTTCISYYCGQCTAIFVDDTKTRVCLP